MFLNYVDFQYNFLIFLAVVYFMFIV